MSKTPTRSEARLLGLATVPRIQRNGRRRPPAVPEVPTDPPEDRLHKGVRELEEGLTAFQAAIDEKSESGVYAAGRSTLLAWSTVESAYNELTPHNLRTILDDNTEFPERAGINDAYRRARRLVLTRIGLHTYRGGTTMTGRTAQAPEIEGDLGFFIVEQTDLAAWVVKDTADLVDLLGQQDLPESEQWRAIGLLRQHQNPWHYSYMTSVLASAGVSGRLWDFTGEPSRALLTVRLSQLFMDLGPPSVGHTERLGLLQLQIVDATARLLQPATPKEVAAQLYGDENLWSSVLLPYNATVVGSAGGDGLMGTGTVLQVDAAYVAAPFQKSMLQMAAQRREQLLATGGEPYIVPNSREVATPGSRVMYYLRTPEGLEMPERGEWFLEPDRAAARRQGITGRVSLGETDRIPPPSPRSSIPGVLPSAPARQPSTTMGVGATWNTAGNHRVICRATYSDGEVREASYTQVVMSLEDKTRIEFGKGYQAPGTREELLERLNEQLAEIPADQSERRAELEEQIRSVEERFDAEAGDLRSLRVVYVGKTAESDAPVTIPLVVFAAVDPEGRAYPRWRRGVHPYRRPLTHQLKLVDFTLPSKVRTYTGASNDMDAAVATLLSEFADDAPYPEGNIQAEVTAESFGGGATPQTYTYPTDGGMLIDDLLRALSFVSLAVGVVGAVAGQPEVAVPAFYIAGYLGGAAASLSLADRLEHGDFEWDVEAAMDILDIAGALLTAGLSQTATATVRGMGRATLLQRTAFGVDVAQIAIVSGVHLAAISTAVKSGDQERVLNALLAAARDGALFVIIHRAAKHMQGTRSGVADPPGGRPHSTTGGVAEPPGTRPHADEPDVYGRREEPSEPATRRERQLQSEGWSREMLEGDMRTARLADPATVEPASSGTYREQLATPQEAYRTYDEALAGSPGNEVAIYRRLDGPNAGTYAVRVGGQFSVASPPRGRWETVLHYHPNPENILTYRMPAPADVQGTMMAAFRNGHPVTEFVEYPLPDGTRGRVAYTVGTNPFNVTTEYVRPDGTRVTRSFPSLEAYSHEWGSRSRYVDPSSPEYEWIVRDIEDYYRSMGADGSSQAGAASTMAGTTRGGAGGPGASSFDGLSIPQLRRRARSNPEAAEALRQRFLAMDDIQLWRYRNDPAAQSVIADRAGFRVEVEAGGPTQFSDSEAYGSLLERLVRARRDVGTPRTQRSAATPEVTRTEGGTVATAQSNLPELRGRSYVGRSPEAGGQRNPASEFAPSTNPEELPQTHAHAEQNLADQLHADLSQIPRSQREGGSVFILVEAMPCSTCVADVLPALSRRYPEITFEIKSLESSSLKRMRGGRYVD